MSNVEIYYCQAINNIDRIEEDKEDEK